MEKPYHFIGNNCKLRPLDWTDKPQALLWKNNASIRDMQLGFVFPITEAMEDKWFESIINHSKDNKDVFFAVDYKDELAGFVSLREIDWINKNAFFSISIGDKYQGQGIGKETLKFMLKYAFNTLNLNKVLLKVIESNRIAQKLYLNAGFNIEGTLKKQIFQNGEYKDVVIMGIFAQDFNKAL